MGETNQEGRGAAGHRPDRPTPAAPGSAVLTPPTGLPAVDAPTPAAPSVPAQRTSPEPTTPTRPPADVPDVRMCTCGHPEEMHEHYRAGHDCGACGPRTCASFRDRDDQPGPLRRVLGRRRG